MDSFEVSDILSHEGSDFLDQGDMDFLGHEGSGFLDHVGMDSLV